MTRTLHLLITFAVANTMLAQLAFIPKDPLTEPYGHQWTFLRNMGQCFDLGGNFREDIVAQSVGTAPTLSILKNGRSSLCFPVFFEEFHAADRTIRLDWTFIGEGVNEAPVEYYDEVEAHWNFYEEFTPEGVTDVRGAKRIVQQKVYDFIDYHVLSNAYGPKFLFVIRPGGNPDEIRMRFEGHDSLKIDVDGMLKMYSGEAFVKLKQCYAYQQQGNTIVDVPWMANYANEPGSTIVKFLLGTYDPTLPLILVTTPWQPEAMGGGGGEGLDAPEWCTYLNGTSSDGIVELTHDDDGYVYLTGFSRSNAGFPIFPGDAQNAFAGEADVVYGRCNANYEFVGPDTWMTYLGGLHEDIGTSIAYDGPRDRIVLCGQMHSQVSNFPNHPLATNSNCYQRNDGHGYVLFARASNGYIDYFTHYQGGLEAYPTGIDVDAAGNVYVVGYGDFEGFELTNLAGSDDYFWDGGTTVPNEGFISKFTPEADHVWGTVLGGPDDEHVYGVHVDRANDQIYVFGNTASHNDPNVVDGSPGSAEFEFPLVNGGGWFQYQHGSTSTIDWASDGFIMRFDRSTLGLTWSTYIGGNGDADCISDVATDASGNIFATGYSNTTIYNQPACGWSLGVYGFPGCHSGSAHFQTTNRGNSDNVMLKFGTSTDLQWSTFVGGAGIEKEYPTNKYHFPRVAVDDDQNVVLYANTTTGAIADQGPPIELVQNEDYYYEFLHRDAGTGAADPTDTYIAVFANDGTPMNATYFGGTGRDYTGGLVAFDGRLYIAGATTSPVNFPLSCPELPDPVQPYCNQTPLCSSTNNDAFMAQLRGDLVNAVDEWSRQGMSSLSLAPNPTNGQVRLIAPEGLSGQRVVVMNALGQTMILSAGLSGNSAILDFSPFADGIYVIGVVETTAQYIRLVKE